MSWDNMEITYNNKKVEMLGELDIDLDITQMHVSGLEEENREWLESASIEVKVYAKVKIEDIPELLQWFTKKNQQCVTKIDNTPIYCPLQWRVTIETLD